jgi:hypothetical protein
MRMANEILVTDRSGAFMLITLTQLTLKKTKNKVFSYSAVSVLLHTPESI